MRSLVDGVVQLFRNELPISFASSRVSFATPTKVGRTRHLKAMEQVGTVFAIVNRTSTAVANVNWHLYRKAASGRKEDRTEVTTHPALTLWNTWNDWYAQGEGVEAGQQHLDLTGEAWIVVGRSPLSDLPLELWCVRPDRMEIVASAKNFIAGYIYHGPNGEQVPLLPNEVLRIRMPHPLDPYRGLGPVQAAMLDIDSARYGAEWNRNFFINSAEPGGIVQVDKRLSDKEFDELRDRWREQHQGVANAHRVAILEQGKWVERKFSMRDMQFTELRRVTRETIFEAYGISKSTLGITEDVNRANAEAGEVLFARWLVTPRAGRWRSMLNHQVLPLFGRENVDLYEFDFDSVVPVSQELENQTRDSQVLAATRLIKDCGFDPAEALEAVGLPAITFAGYPEERVAAAAPPPVEEVEGEVVSEEVVNELVAEIRRQLTRRRMEVGSA